jgi:hypothetical protein
VDVVGELSTLRDKLGSLSGEAAPSGTGDWLARLQQLEVNEKPAVGEVPAAVPAQVSTLDAAEVDKRLTALEQHIGVAQDSDVSYAPHHPLQDVR